MATLQPPEHQPASEPPICIWHKGCLDGFTSAWVVRRFFHGTDVEFFAGAYGEPPPDVTGRNVLMVDFSYKHDVIEKMREKARAILILDHHKTAEADLAAYHVRADKLDGFPYFPTEGECAAFFDMNRSGAGLCWDFFFPGQKMPALVQHVQDRDLWRFQIAGTREINTLAHSYDFNFSTWDNLASLCESENGWKSLVDQGHGLQRQREKDCKALIGEGKRVMVIGGMPMIVVNAPWFMASEIGNMISETDVAKCGATYYDRGDGKRVFSLRSVEGGPDVSEIAKRYGGGGHKHAAGFSKPLNWEGETMGNEQNPNQGQGNPNQTPPGQDPNRDKPGNPNPGEGKPAEHPGQGQPTPHPEPRRG